MDSPEDEPDTTDWCVGGCDFWEETEGGRARYNELARRNISEKAAGRPHV